VIVDRFTKYILYVATKKILTTSVFAGLVLDYVFRPFGLPSSIVSDWGSLFTSNFWTTFYAYLSIEQRLSIAYYPQTDGQTERQN
jgi:transposase InsO family protein